MDQVHSRALAFEWFCPVVNGETFAEPRVMRTLHRQLWIAALVLVGCGEGSTGGTEEAKPVEPSAKVPGDKVAPPPSAESTAKSFVAALASGDRKTVEALTPDAATCKATKLTQCGPAADLITKHWDQVKVAAAAYKDAKLAKTGTLPVMDATAWTAEVAGKEPLEVLVFKSGDRSFALARFPGVKPPSTGKEMAQVVAMKPAEAMEIVKAAMTAAKAPKRDCKKIADDLMLALPVALPKVDDASAEPYKVLQRCALETGRWQSAIQAGVALLETKAADSYVIAQIPRAFVEMGEHDKAIEVVKKLAKAFPKEEKSLVIAQLFAVCHAERYANCVKGGEAIMATFKKAKIADNDPDMMLARFFRNLGWTALDRPGDAIADFKAMEKIWGREKLASIGAPRVIAFAEKAVERGFYLEITPLPQFPTGVYHLMGKESTGSLLTLKIREQAGIKRNLRVELEVSGVTDKSSNSLELGPKQAAMRLYNPPLKVEFDASKIRSPRPSQLVIKITEDVKGTPKTILDETIPLEVLPRDYLPLRRLIGADKFAPTFEYIGAWITSNDKTVEEFLTKAKARHPKKQFVGEQDETVSQIKALYDELKARGMSYVMDPNVTSTQSFVQRTRLPAEVLASTNAQCLEGTLTFATLMEAIGIKPIVVFVPGHAFVGWHPVAKDGTNGKPIFLETTMVGGYEFEQAIKVANARVEQELAANHFKTGAAHMLDVGKIRAGGFSAMPM